MATILRIAPYKDDETNLPVKDVESATPYYEEVMGFRLKSRTETPVKRVLLQRDNLQIGLAENGGDPEQEGCFFEVDDVEEMFQELKSNGLDQDEANFRVDQHGETSYKVFFVIAPDGLCYCIGQRQS